MEVAGNKQILTARDTGLVTCRRCLRVWPMDNVDCGRCGAALQSRDTQSLQRVWSLLIAGLICYVPANIYPMLITQTLANSSGSTIVGGAIDLLHHGAVGVAVIILVASVLIPVGKFLAIAYLALSIHRGSTRSAERRHHMYEMVEFIGRWSMIDVFVVAILSALVQLSVVASIHPGPAALTFALSVIFTMLSAQAFDTRLFWDQTARQRNARD